MSKRTYYDLKVLEGCKFYLREDLLDGDKRELESFLSDMDYLQSETFARKVMFSQELKANNQIEGYCDDIREIREYVKNPSTPSTSKYRKARILNLYNAYNYIMTHKDINKETLRELYSLTSDRLLGSQDRENMGEYYRNKPVYILRNGRLDTELDTGIPEDRIDEFMESYFNFLNTKLNGSETDEYIKSQILHFYFVYIHPYFDVNGRTSRTLAMWYLLNKKAYPYIIFNRGIPFKGSEYDKNIIRSKETRDMTYFIKFMLDTVMVELEKEYVMQIAAGSANAKLDAIDFETLLHFLSMKGLKTVLDFGTFYERFNGSVDIRSVYNDMIEPLLDKGVLDVVSETKKEVRGVRNKVLTLRPLDIDPEKVKHLQL